MSRTRNAEGPEERKKRSTPNLCRELCRLPPMRRKREQGGDCRPQLVRRSFPAEADDLTRRRSRLLKRSVSPEPVEGRIGDCGLRIGGGWKRSRKSERGARKTQEKSERGSRNAEARTFAFPPHSVFLVSLLFPLSFLLPRSEFRDPPSAFSSAFRLPRSPERSALNGDTLSSSLCRQSGRASPDQAGRTKCGAMIGEWAGHPSRAGAKRLFANQDPGPCRDTEPR